MYGGVGIVEEFQEAVSIVTLLADLLEVLADAHQGLVERGGCGYGQCKLADGDLTPQDAKAHVEIANAVAERIGQIGTEIVFQLTVRLVRPEADLHLTQFFALVAHHVAAVVHADVLTVAELREFVEDVAEDAVALREFQEELCVDELVAVFEVADQEHQDDLYGQKQRTVDRDHAHGNRHEQEVENDLVEAVQDGHEAAAVPADTLFRFVLLIQDFRVLRVGKFHAHGFRGEHLGEAGVEDLRVDVALRVRDVDQNVGQELCHHGDRRENDDAPKVLVRALAADHGHEFVDQKFRKQEDLQLPEGAAYEADQVQQVEAALLSPCK